MLQHIRRPSSCLIRPLQSTIIEECKEVKLKMINQYLLVTKIGCGSFSKVYLAQQINDSNSDYMSKIVPGFKQFSKDETKNFTSRQPPIDTRCSHEKEFVAAKAIHIHEKHIHDNSPSSILDREIKIMRALKHPNIVQLYDVLYASSIDTAYMLLELAECGTLQNAITKRAIFDDKSLASIFIQVIDGLSYLHSYHIVHHDIKPSNILLFKDGSVKISDFGIGHTFQSADMVIGTPAYQAPELFIDDNDSASFLALTMSDKRMPHGNSKLIDDDLLSDSFNSSESVEIEGYDPTKCDVWSLGVALYQTAYGVLPYYGSNLYEIVHNIKSTPLVIPETNQYSQLLPDLLTKMLKVNPTERFSLDEIKRHPFFTTFCNGSNENLTQMDHLSSYKQDVASFLDKNIDEGRILVTIPPKIDETAHILKYQAVVCQDNYSFKRDLHSKSLPSWQFQHYTQNGDIYQNTQQLEKAKSMFLKH